MNRFITSATAFGAGLWLAACLSAGAPNDTVKKAFTTRFGPCRPRPVQTVTWTHNADFSYAHFTQRGKSVVAVFGNDGQFIATEPAKPIQ